MQDCKSCTACEISNGNQTGKNLTESFETEVLQLARDVKNAYQLDEEQLTQFNNKKYKTPEYLKSKLSETK